MKAKRVKAIVKGGVTALVVLMLFLLMIGTGGIPTESFEAAQGRGYAMMFIEGIQGPYQTQPYSYHIKVIDFKFGIDNVGTAAQGGSYSSAPQFSEITVVKEIDKTSPLLAMYCAEGRTIPYVLIKLMPTAIWPPPSGPPDPHYYIVTLEDVVISKIKNRVVYRESDLQYGHLEELSFRCNRIGWEDIGSATTEQWDLQRNIRY